MHVLLGRTSRAGVDVSGDGKPDVSLSSLGYPGGLIGGVTPEAPELWRRGFPTGQGNIKLSYTIGGGADVNLTERIFVGTDLRYNFLDGDGDYATYTGKVGFRW
jgi:opacity protein-like surface antigen